MTASKSSKPPCLGFLTVVDIDDQGSVGGYLIVNLAGRPLEFHCTAPVRANRAQEILFGPTLEPYLFGEQIGHALYSRSKLTPAILFTDREPVMSLRSRCPTPILLIQDDAADVSRQQLGTRAREHHGLDRFSLGRHSMAIHQEQADDRQIAIRLWDELRLDLDLAEPFERIQEAVHEARRAA